MDGPTARNLQELIFQLRHELFELMRLLWSVQGRRDLLPADQLRKFLGVKDRAEAVHRGLVALIEEADREEARRRAGGSN